MSLSPPKLEFPNGSMQNRTLQAGNAQERSVEQDRTKPSKHRLAFYFHRFVLVLPAFVYFFCCLVFDLL